MAKMKLFEVRESKIHGKGLFAAKNIKAGEELGKIKGKKSKKKEGPYILWLGPKKAIEVVGALKYINHSSKPNACYYEDLRVVALKDIKKDEEITHHYGEDWD